MKYIDRRRRIEQVVQRAQLFYAANGSGRWTGLSCCIMIKKSIEQALRKHGVHRLSSIERLSHKREHGENVRDLGGKKRQCLNGVQVMNPSKGDTDEVRVDDFGMMQEI